MLEESNNVFSLSHFHLLQLDIIILFIDSKHMYHISTDSMHSSQIQNKRLVTMSMSFSPLKWDYTVLLFKS